MKKKLLLGLFLLISFQAFTQFNVTFKSSQTYSSGLNDIWGYADASGNEYALVGLTTGVNILDVTNPSTPVDKGTIPGPTTSWRDLKTFGTRAFVTNEHSGGLLIIELGGLPSPITASDYFNWEPTITGLGTITDCHNIYIDENGVGYLTGCNVNRGAPIYIDCTSTPNPTYLGKAPIPSATANHDYAHDVYVRGDIMYTSNIYQGRFRVYDVSNKTNSIFLGDINTPYNFTHNAWLNDASNVLFTTDETGNAPVASFDVSNPTDIEKLDEFRPLSIITPPNVAPAIPHNVHVINDFLVISYYTYGVVIVDATVPDNLIEVGHYDTNSFNGGGYNGVWGAYPFLPSGNILASDRQNGCFVLDPTYVPAARLNGFVTNAATGQRLAGVDVTISSAELNQETSSLIGQYKTGLATAGTYDVTFFREDYHPKTISVTFVNGVNLNQNVQLDFKALDIDLIDFDVKLVDQKDVELNWKALSDDDYITFEIERSSNGIDFEMVGKEIDRSPSLFEKIYNYIDLSVPQKELLYRLKMIEPDGSFTYSPIKSIDNTKGHTPSIGIFPNPVKSGEYLVFENTSNEELSDFSFQLFNSSGMKVTSDLLSGAGQSISF